MLNQFEIEYVKLLAVN